MGSLNMHRVYGVSLRASAVRTRWARPSIAEGADLLGSVGLPGHWTGTVPGCCGAVVAPGMVPPTTYCGWNGLPPLSINFDWL